MFSLGSTLPTTSVVGSWFCISLLNVKLVSIVSISTAPSFTSTYLNSNTFDLFKIHCKKNANAFEDCEVNACKAMEHYSTLRDSRQGKCTTNDYGYIVLQSLDFRSLKIFRWNSSLKDDACFVVTFFNQNLPQLAV